ncbi:MAG: Rne/Rng family ribonuclease [Miltoncostaeaceae bacterium]
MAILEDGRTAECYIERRGRRSVVGHVWKGRVENVLAGMEASFVDVGLPKSGFLHVDEVVAQGVPKRKRQIADLLSRNDEVMVQATKDPMGTKGSRLTMQLSLAGRFVVYVPYGDGIGVSKRLSDDERVRLRAICGALPLEEGGLIVRTAATGVSARDLARDLANLKLLWKALQERAAAAKAPTLLYSEADVSLRVIRDLLNVDVDEVIVDDESQFQRITGFLRRTSPEMADRVRYYDDEQPMMEHYGVEAAIRSTLDRRAPLPGGGYLIIDDTEAMTVIDVNSGRNVGKGGNRLEDTVTKTNLEAAVEVVRQLRLRDIGGIVLIDFIDMDDADNRRAVKDILDAELSRDRTRTFVGEISALGLVEMTRQNISDGPREVMTHACQDCDGGLGFVVSDETNAITVERGLRKKLRGRGDAEVRVTVHPHVAALLGEEDGARLQDLEADLGVRIRLERDGGLPRDGVRVGQGSGATSAPSGPSAPASSAPAPAPEAAPAGGKRVKRRREGAPESAEPAPAAPAPEEPPAAEAPAEGEGGEPAPGSPRPRSRRRATSRSRSAAAEA